MSRLPNAHRLRRHADLLRNMAAHARLSFPDHELPGRGELPGWDPTLPRDPADDLGRGLLDVTAQALHVLWTYHQAWAEEGFLALAQVQTSVDRLLARIGYEPTPALAATGLQHFRVQQGESGLLPAGFGVRATRKGESPEQDFETLVPLALDARLNSLRAYLEPASEGDDQASDNPAGASGAEGGSGLTDPAPVTVPAVSGSVADQLSQRLKAGQGDHLAARRAQRARARMHQLRSLISELQAAGGAGCEDALSGLCQELCEAQQIAQGAVPVGPPTAAQKLAARQLDRLDEGALAALEAALDCPCDTPQERLQRVEAMARFLDAFVAGMLQGARDQVVLLKGPQALADLDRRLKGRGPARLGVAAPGASRLHLLATTQDGAATSGTLDDVLRVGDWLILQEEREITDAQGRARTERVATEALRILELSRSRPAGLRQEVTTIVFEPPLRRRYRLDRVTLLGNVAPISAGRSVVQPLALEMDGRTALLDEGPLTWLSDPNAAGGRRPEVEVHDPAASWERVDHLLDHAPEAPVFSVERCPGGGARVRFGPAIEATSGRALELRYRTGAGRDGNVDAGRIGELIDTHPVVVSTTNPLPTTLGADGEDTRRARQQGPASLRALDRAASHRDLVALATSQPGVDRARVVPGRSRGRVTLVVGSDLEEPLAASELVRLHALLAARIPPGIALRLRLAERVPVRLGLTLSLEPGADPAEVEQRCRVRLGALADEQGSLRGPLSLWETELGEDLPLSTVYAALARVEGLESALVTTLARADRPALRSERVACQPHERLVWGAPPDLEIRYEWARDR